MYPLGSPLSDRDGPMLARAAPVATPVSAPGLFQNPIYRGTIDCYNYNPLGLMGAGNKGVDEWTRILHALRSGIPSEINWATSALLRHSYTSPQAFQLASQPDVIQGLLTRISGAFFLHFLSGSNANGTSSSGSTNGVNSSNGASSLSEQNVGAIHSWQLSDSETLELQYILESLLVIRNASLEPTNAQTLSADPLCRDIVVAGMMLPDHSLFNEFRAYCVEIAEQIAYHLPPESESDSLFKVIVHTLTVSEDRGVLLSALRGFSRMSVRDEHNVIFSISTPLLNKMVTWLLLDDEDLISAVLDFLYQYTVRLPNVDALLEDHNRAAICTSHLVRLLAYKMDEPKRDFVRRPRLTRRPVPPAPPALSDEIVEELLEYQEPDRATHWIRTCYEEDPDGEVTQISLWKSYESQFKVHARQAGRPLLQALVFIKNVTSAFRSAAAMVVSVDDQTKKFVIRGIRPRDYPLPPSVLNAPKADAKEPRREPSSFGVTAAMVLTNMSKSKAGAALLAPYFTQMVRAMLLNASIAEYVENVLDNLA